MKQRFWLFKRGNVYYLQDSETGKQESLRTRDHAQALKLQDAKNQAIQQPQLGTALAKAYLSVADPALVTRTWSAVIDRFCDSGKESTRTRRKRAMRNTAFDRIRNKKLIETTAEDFHAVVNAGGKFTNHCLRLIHNLALGLGWLTWPVIPPKLWPPAPPKRKRGITWDEHQKIITSEQNQERRMYYELLWEIGAAQTDTALLRAEDISWETRTLSFQRHKTGEWCHLTIGARLETLLRRMPSRGPLFPTISLTTASARSAEFYRRCRLAKVTGVSLHSYRYAWAERARAAGYPERWAQNALGHNCRAVHAAYARNAVAICPSLEEYERPQRSAEQKAA